MIGLLRALRRTLVVYVTDRGIDTCLALADVLAGIHARATAITGRAPTAEPAAPPRAPGTSEGR